MRILDIQEMTPHAITHYASHGVTLVPLVRSDGELSTVMMRLEPGGCLGMHQARCRQLFWVIEGRGWVSSGETRHPIRAGQAVLWESGEQHQTESETGLRAVVFEGERLQAMGMDV